MSIGLETDFKIYPEQFWGGVVETLQQYTDAFNASSNNALRLVSRAVKGDYEKESFIKSTLNLISRRDPTTVGAVTDNKLTQGELVGIKVNRRIGPVAQTLDAFKKIAVDPGEFSVLLGQQTGKAIAVDYVNAALNAVRAGIAGVAALQYDNSAQGTPTATHTALVNGLANFGDAASRIICWVMYSKNYFDLMKQAIADKVFEVAGVTIYQGTVATFNRPTVVIDSSSLVTTVPGSAAQTTYDILGLVEDAVEVAESEERSIISQPVTGLENLVMRIQGEHAFNLRVKGCAWNLGAVGSNPTDIQIGTASNWTQVVADNKLMPGVRITVK
jgi:hypothetical protein